MKLLFVADGRSPIALNWMRYFAAAGHAVHLVSLYPCKPDVPLASLRILPAPLAGALPPGEAASGEAASLRKGLRSLGRSLASPAAVAALRHWLLPLRLPRLASHLRQILSDLRPDLVHAMRIPYEGMLAALALEGLRLPLLVSVWGNDFTLHAGSTPAMRRLTRRALARADALHTDCQRDARLGRAWGFAAEKPVLVAPGAGGIQGEVFYPPEKEPGPLVVNPRGLRAYARTDTFFQALPQVLKRFPQARFACPSMLGKPEAEKWVRSLGLEEAVRLLPRLPRPQMAELFRSARVVASVTTHDGTPNTLLEALACGCFPVAGDIESLREWITPGVNGLLVPPDAPQALAEALLRALEDADLRASARSHNLALIREKADYAAVMPRAEEFYRQVAGQSGGY